MAQAVSTERSAQTGPRWQAGDSRTSNDGRGEVAALGAAILYRGDGLSRGEKALAALAVSVQTGCAADSRHFAQEAARLTKDRRTVDLVLEEGFPSPITGRRGTIVTTAARLATPFQNLRDADLQRLHLDRFDPEETLDLLLASAFATLHNRLPAVSKGRDAKEG
ncbi:hypothetical protein D2T31_15220 [Sinirhodobacter populi]|uniref:Carboxymuconolactone decarboxylase-like domain-containing protein n=1 Tax=Paenirhodobacter populi TaxID=2306993 RepID=A0A443K547_9RHOB|nr:carboxymuconolactone decarboxylase family protein [Sinirhodobacter populi]RWR27872.1 hypothetical protein D2T31_15220 [Sinirhodobacter populi]